MSLEKEPAGAFNKAQRLIESLLHREQHDHPVIFVADVAAACEGQDFLVYAMVPGRIARAESCCRQPSPESRTKSSSNAATSARCLVSSAGRLAA